MYIPQIANEIAIENPSQDSQKLNNETTTAGATVAQALAHFMVSRRY